MHTDNSNRWFAIVNPVSGNGKSGRKWNEVRQELLNAKIDFEFEFTTKVREAESIVQATIQQGFRKIISVGGDGNLHDIANGLLSQSIVSSSEVTLAIISLGTGNDFVKHYKIPTKIQDAIGVIKKGNVVLHDAGKAISYEDGKANARYFINFCGVGFDAFVVERAAPLKPYGQIAYLLGTLRWMFPYKKPLLRITTAERVIETECYLVLAGIGKYSGGGMMLTPGAIANDGKFFLTIAKNLSKIEVVLRLKMLYDGSIGTHREVECFQTDIIRIEVLQEYFPVKMQADGDVLGIGPFDISIIPKALKIVVP